MGKYDDIINLPPHISKTHKHMSNNDRAAQFLPFAALTGYDASIIETARMTVEKRTISSEDRENISKKLNILLQHIKEQPLIYITYFVKDTKKSGGEYVYCDCQIKKIDEFNKTLTLSNGIIISFDNIYCLASPIIDEYQYLY